MADPTDSEPADDGGTAKLLGVGSLILAAGSTVVLVLSSDARLLRLGIVAALWAALLASLAYGRLRARVREQHEWMVEQQRIYELELEREIAARREFELEAENEARDKAAENSGGEFEQLRDELRGLRSKIERMARNEVRYEPVRQHPDQAPGAVNGTAHPGPKAPAPSAPAQPEAPASQQQPDGHAPQQQPEGHAPRQQAGAARSASTTESGTLDAVGQAQQNGQRPGHLGHRRRPQRPAANGGGTNGQVQPVVESAEASVDDRGTQRMRAAAATPPPASAAPPGAPVSPPEQSEPRVTERQAHGPKPLPPARYVDPTAENGASAGVPHRGSNNGFDADHSGPARGDARSRDALAFGVRTWQGDEHSPAGRRPSPGPDQAARAVAENSPAPDRRPPDVSAEHDRSAGHDPSAGQGDERAQRTDNPRPSDTRRPSGRVTEEGGNDSAGGAQDRAGGFSTGAAHPASGAHTEGTSVNDLLAAYGGTSESKRRRRREE